MKFGLTPNKQIDYENYKSSQSRLKTLTHHFQMVPRLVAADEMKTQFQRRFARQEKSTGAQSIQRAIKLLHIVAQHNDQGTHLSEIASKAGLHIATAHRILTVLKSEALITYDATAKLYHLGITLYHLGCAAQQFALCDSFRTTLEMIAHETEDTAFLLVRSGNEAMCIDRVEGRFPIRTLTFDVGDRKPLGIGAGALALLAFLPDGQIEKVLSDNESRYPLHKQCTKEDIRAFIAQSRRLGFAYSKGNVTLGASAVGLPIYDKDGNLLAAISVAAIDRRMNRKRRVAIITIIRSAIEAVGHYSVGSPGFSEAY